MSITEERWQERLTEARAQMSSAIKPETLAQRYDAETPEEIEELTNQALKEMWRGDHRLLTLDDLDDAERKLDEAGDYEIVTDGGQSVGGIDHDDWTECDHCGEPINFKEVSSFCKTWNDEHFWHDECVPEYNAIRNIATGTDRPEADQDV